MSGGLGDDSITLNGQVGENLLGHSVYGDGVLSGGFTNGGDDQIINGTTSGDVMGDGILNFLGGNGGDDTIIINGTVGGNIVGDGIASLLGGSGGNDIIVINGTVLGDVLADGVASIFGNGGDDEVAVAEGATILGIIDGGKGTDKLTLFGVYQDELDLLDPQGGSVTSGSKTYTWINFEFLIGKIREVVSELVESDNGRRIIYPRDLFAGRCSREWHQNLLRERPGGVCSLCRIASMNTGDSLTYQAAIANSVGTL
ncbi:MAG: hypothetical protein KIS85_02900 [Anaerolineales bacterium]|nr:hypothetical protein [Anaerolineales bacterium]